MLGIIYLLMTGTAYTISGIKAGMSQARNKKEGRIRKEQGNNPENFYVDRKGGMRDLDTDQWAKRENDRLTGDIWIRYGAPSVRVRNISAEWRKAFYNKMKANPEPGRTVVNSIRILEHQSPDTIKWTDTKWRNEYWCVGQWYKDLVTGRLYVIRIYTIEIEDTVHKKYSGEFYMDIKTRKLVRLTDDFIRDNKRTHFLSNEIAQTMIDKWNQEIDSGMHELRSDVSYDWHQYYFNRYNGYSIQSRKELEMMGNCKPFALA